MPSLCQGLTSPHPHQTSPPTCVLAAALLRAVGQARLLIVAVLVPVLVAVAVVVVAMAVVVCGVVARLSWVLARLCRVLGHTTQVRLAGVHGGDGAHHSGVVVVLVHAVRLLVARRRVRLAAPLLQVALVRALNQVVNQLRGGGQGGSGGGCMPESGSEK